MLGWLQRPGHEPEFIRGECSGLAADLPGGDPLELAAANSRGEGDGLCCVLRQELRCPGPERSRCGCRRRSQPPRIPNTATSSRHQAGIQTPRPTREPGIAWRKLIRSRLVATAPVLGTEKEQKRAQGREIHQAKTNSSNQKCEPKASEHPSQFPTLRRSRPNSADPYKQVQALIPSPKTTRRRHTTTPGITSAAKLMIQRQAKSGHNPSH